MLDEGFTQVLQTPPTKPKPARAFFRAAFFLLRSPFLVFLLFLGGWSPCMTWPVEDIRLQIPCFTTTNTVYATTHSVSYDYKFRVLSTDFASPRQPLWAAGVAQVLRGGCAASRRKILSLM